MLSKIVFVIAAAAVFIQVYPRMQKPAPAPVAAKPVELYVGGTVANMPSGMFRVTGLVNYKGCRVEDDLSSNCQERKLPAPDEVVLRLADGADGKTFELSSYCRRVYGQLHHSADGALKVDIAAETDDCGGREVSLYHDRVFDRFFAARGLFVSAKKFKLASGQGEGLALAWLPGRELASVASPVK